jgi:hypothetical protein
VANAHTPARAERRRRILGGKGSGTVGVFTTHLCRLATDTATRKRGLPPMMKKSATL